jgi:hypothetical protein
LYPDGEKSELLDKATAKGYANIFDGTMVRANKKEYFDMLRTVLVIVIGGTAVALVRIFTDQP